MCSRSARVADADPEAAAEHWKEPGIEDRLQCFFESLGSPSGCRHEDPAMQSGAGAFRDLHSNWINDSILACVRPSEAMLDRGLAEQFKDQGIRAVLNLQEKGEHPWCGPGVTSSGFSYQPHRFQEAGVDYHHLPWQDMGCPAFDTMLSIVRVMDSVISQGGKVAIHCHAGLGRTGLVAACYLVHNGAMPAAEAISLVRTKRPGSVQTSRQATYVKDFESFMRLGGAGSTDAMPLLQGTHLSQAQVGKGARAPSLFTHFWQTAARACLEFLVFILTCCCRRRMVAPAKGPPMEPAGC